MAKRRVTNAQITDILRLRFAEGWLLRRIAMHFGVSQSYVSMVCRGHRRS